MLHLPTCKNPKPLAYILENKGNVCHDAWWWHSNRCQMQGEISALIHVMFLDFICSAESRINISLYFLRYNCQKSSCMWDPINRITSQTWRLNHVMYYLNFLWKRPEEHITFHCKRVQYKTQSHIHLPLFFLMRWWRALPLAPAVQKSADDLWCR